MIKFVIQAMDYGHKLCSSGVGDYQGGRRKSMFNWFKRKNKAAREPEETVQSEETPREEFETVLREEASEADREAPAETFEAAENDFGSTADREGEIPGTAEEDAPEGFREEPPEDEADGPEGEDGEDAPVQEKRRFFKKLRERLHKTREKLANRVDRLVLGKKVIDTDMLDELEEVLITSDLGVRTTQLLLQRVTDKIRRQELKDPQKLREALREEIRTILEVPADPWDLAAHHPCVVMVIGVNGVGKTTTIGKLSHQWKQEGRKVMLVAGDTFRAAAVEQLALWGERADVPVVRQKSGSDPSAVVFDAIDAAVSRDMDVVLIDTAGRMHTKVNLMEELKKVHRVVTRKMPDAPHEVLLVLDASTGQNALSQATLFKEGIGITGLILTKLDGTAKGGIVVAICDELKVPVRFIGIGEGIEDLRPFDPEEFTRALL
ncbi:MAG: signal recognition particle-docking protein FtsY [Desulfobacteraceae bacterium]|nr:signal recognition particle-docking protein FtsY [Desulfobacteraceae bacterium]